MAKYRAIYTIMWKDPDFQVYTPDAKLLFIYLCTNDSTSESGIYPITEKTIADETGLKKEAVTKLLANHLKNIIYDASSRFVYIRRFRTYNNGGRPELMQKAICNEYKLSGQTFLWSYFIKDYPLFSDIITSVSVPPAPPLTNSKDKDKDIEPLSNGLPTVDKRLGNESKKYGEFQNVLLSETEHRKLLARFGDTEAAERIERLSGYVASKKTNYMPRF
jgi:hypothetical protein